MAISLTVYSVSFSNSTLNSPKKKCHLVIIHYNLINSRFQHFCTHRIPLATFLFGWKSDMSAKIWQALSPMFLNNNKQKEQICQLQTPKIIFFKKSLYIKYFYLCSKCRVYCTLVFWLFFNHGIKHYLYSIGSVNSYVKCMLYFPVQ